MIGNQTKSKRGFLWVVMMGLERHEWVSDKSESKLERTQRGVGIEKYKG